MAKVIEANKTGELSEAAREDIAESKREDMPAKAFLDRDNRRYPVMRRADGQWRWDCNLIRAAERRARLNGDAAIEAKARDLWARVCGQTDEDEEE